MNDKNQLTNPGVDLNITFFYYKDLQTAMDFYQNKLGFKLLIDQGWSKIYQVSSTSCIGLVDEKRGFHKSSTKKPVIFCMRVSDVDEWYRFLQERAIAPEGKPEDNLELKIRAFFVSDPEGYVLEFQSPLP